MAAGSPEPAARAFQVCRARRTGEAVREPVRFPVMSWSCLCVSIWRLRFGAVLRTEGKEFAVFGCRTDQPVILRERQLELRCLIETLKCLFEQPLDDRAHLFVAVDVMTQRVIAGLLDEPGGILLRQTNDAPHSALADATFAIEHVLAQRLRLWPDVAGAREQEGALAGRIERAFVFGQFKRTGLQGARMGAQQRLCTAIANLDGGIVNAH